LTFLDPQESAKFNGGKGVNPERAWDMGAVGVVE
jgi:hypothetical protein